MSAVSDGDRFGFGVDHIVETAQQQRPKDATAMKLDVSSSLGRKRNAENDMGENAAEKQRLNAPLSSSMMLTKSSKAAKAGSNIVVCVKPAPNTNFSNSALYTSRVEKLKQVLV